MRFRLSWITCNVKEQPFMVASPCVFNNQWHPLFYEWPYKHNYQGTIGSVMLCMKIADHTTCKQRGSSSMRNSQLIQVYPDMRHELNEWVFLDLICFGKSYPEEAVRSVSGSFRERRLGWLLFQCSHGCIPLEESVTRVLTTLDQVADDAPTAPPKSMNLYVCERRNVNGSRHWIWIDEQPQLKWNEGIMHAHYYMQQPQDDLWSSIRISAKTKHNIGSTIDDNLQAAM